MESVPLWAPEEHYRAGEKWLREAERWEPSLSPWRAAMATAHFTAALYRPPVRPAAEIDDEPPNVSV